MTTEEKVLEKFRKVLIADTVIDGYMNTRVYASHISSIRDPKFPAISMALLNSTSQFYAEDVKQMRIQIDIWLQLAEYTSRDILRIKERVSVLLHRKNLTDNTIGVKFAQCFEDTGSGPLIVDETANLYHFPITFRVAAI